MFKTFGNTLELIQASWRVLQEDRRLILLPVASAVAVLIMAALMLGVFAGTGTLDRLNGEGTVEAVDVIIAVATYTAAVFIIIYFNAALVAIAYERLRGGNPSLRYGLRVSQRHIWSILGWAMIAATVELILSQLRDSDNLVGKIVGWIASSLWAFSTFFVIPILVVEGVSPVEAMRRSTSLLSKTWGNQFVANFGFFFGYILVAVIAIIPIAIGAAVAPEAAVILGVLLSLPIVVIGFANLLAMEGIFKAALYQYAAGGEVHQYFSESAMRNAYVAKDDKGSWGTGGGSNRTQTLSVDHSSAEARLREIERQKQEGAITTEQAKVQRQRVLDEAMGRVKP